MGSKSNSFLKMKKREEETESERERKKEAYKNPIHFQCVTMA
jgi:hypothetical protein